MKKVFKRILCFMVMTIIVLSMMTFSGGAEDNLEILPKKFLALNYIEEIEKNNEKIEIIVIGNDDLSKLSLTEYIEYEENNVKNKENILQYTIEDKKTVSYQLNKHELKIKNTKNIDKLKDISLNDKIKKDNFKAIFISEEKVEQALDDENIDYLRDAVDKGYQVYFLGNTRKYIGIANERIAGHKALQIAEITTANEDVSDNDSKDFPTPLDNIDEVDENEFNIDDEAVENDVLLMTYICKNKIGDFEFGELTVSENVDEDEKTNLIVTHAYARRNMYFYSLEDNMNEIESIQRYGIDAMAYNYDGFIISDNYGTFSSYYTATQMIKALNSDTYSVSTYWQRYYVSGRYMTITSKIEACPNFVTGTGTAPLWHCTRSVAYTTQRESDNTTLNIIDFEPKVVPSSTNLSFEVGISGKALGVSFSYSQDVDDITITPLYSSSLGKASLLVKYKNVIDNILFWPTNYSQSTTISRSTVIFDTVTEKNVLTLNTEFKSKYLHDISIVATKRECNEIITIKFMWPSCSHRSITFLE